MRSTDRKQFAATLAAVYSLYRSELSEAVLQMWWGALSGYEIEAIASALTAHTSNPDTGQFLPKPADVVKMLGGTTKDAAIVAFAKVVDGVKSAGSWSSVAFDDPIIHRVLEDLGGWTVVCATTEKEWPFLEKRFVDAYRAWRQKGDVPPHPPRLAGRTEIANVAAGYTDAEVPLRLIGNREEARAIADGSRAPALAFQPKRIAP